MKKEATAKASAKLTEARNQIQKMKEASGPDELEIAWIYFLMAIGTFYSSLYKGAKNNNKSQPWFGKKKHECRKDELLSYLHGARNAEEHGLLKITKRLSSQIKLKKQGDAVHLVFDGKNWIVEASIGDIEYANDIIRLTAVYDDRFHEWCAVPTIHLNSKIDDPSPIIIAQLAVHYFEAMLAEAVSLET